MLLVVIRRTAGVAAVFGLVAALLAAASCQSSSGSENGVDDRLTACDLTTRADVADALGGPVSVPTAAEDAATDSLAGRTGCAWSRRDRSGAVLVELVRTADMAAAVRRTGFSAAARFEAARSRAATQVPVELGDEAFWIEDESTLHVLRDRTYVVFEVAVTPTARAKPIANELARSALTRIDEWAGAD
jgi:hypothetical protein